jgi:hypothetical protein
MRNREGFGVTNRRPFCNAITTTQKPWFSFTWRCAVHTLRILLLVSSILLHLIKSSPKRNNAIKEEINSTSPLFCSLVWPCQEEENASCVKGEVLEPSSCSLRGYKTIIHWKSSQAIGNPQGLSQICEK